MGKTWDGWNIIFFNRKLYMCPACIFYMADRQSHMYVEAENTGHNMSSYKSSQTPYKSANLYICQYLSHVVHQLLPSLLQPSSRPQTVSFLDWIGGSVSPIAHPCLLQAKWRDSNMIHSEDTEPLHYSTDLSTAHSIDCKS